MIEAPQLYTPSEVAVILKVSRRTVYSYIASRQLASVKVGHYRRISAQALDAFIHGRNAASEDTAEVSQRPQKTL